MHARIVLLIAAIACTMLVAVQARPQQEGGGDQGGQEQGGGDGGGAPPDGSQQQGGGGGGGPPPEQVGGGGGGQQSSPQQGGGPPPSGGSPPQCVGGSCGGGGGFAPPTCSSCPCYWCYGTYNGWSRPGPSILGAASVSSAGWLGGHGGAAAAASAGPGGAFAAAGSGLFGNAFGRWFGDVSAAGEVKDKKAACQAIIEQYSDKGPVEARNLVKFINQTFYGTPADKTKNAKGVAPSTFHCCHTEFGTQFFPSSKQKYVLPILPKGVTCTQLVSALFDKLSSKQKKSGKPDAKANVAALPAGQKKTKAAAA